MKKESLKSLYILVGFGILLFAVLMNFDHVLDFIRNIGNMVFPIILGLIFAFIINVPMNGIYKRLRKFVENRNIGVSESACNVISLLLTLVCLILVIIIVLVILVPELIRSVQSVSVLLKEQWPVMKSYLDGFNLNTDKIGKWIESSELDVFIEQLTTNAGNFAGFVMDFAGSTVSGIATAGIAFVIALYVLASKASLGRQCRKFTDAYVKKNIADKIYYVCSLVHETYAKFLSGQCLEAVILGTLIFIAFHVFSLPYAGLTAVLTTALAFIPYIGAFCACGIGAVLTLLAEPSKILLSIVVYLAVQFIENNFIYPHVVGNSVGLSPLWTLIAVLIGGDLFGILGMIMFIPLTSVIYALIKEDANRRLRKVN